MAKILGALSSDLMLALTLPKIAGKLRFLAQIAQILQMQRRLSLNSISVDLNLKVGDKFEGKVKKVAHFGVFVEIKNGIDGLIHSSKLARNGLNLGDFSEGQSVSVEITGINNDKIELGLC